MCPHEECKCSTHRIEIQRLKELPRITARKGIWNRALLQTIHIRLAPCRMPRTEIPRCLPCLRDDDIRRQKTVHRARQTVRRDTSVRKEIHHLTVSVNTGIRAPRCGKLHLLTADLRQCSFEHILHGDHGRRLPLKAVIMRAVIGNLQCNIACTRLHPLHILRAQCSAPQDSRHRSLPHR